jgi:hypothetical protein
MQCPDIPQRQCRLKFNLWLVGRAPLGTKQRIENRIDLTTRLINATERGHHTQTRFAAVSAKRLGQLDIGVTGCFGDFDVHGK